MIRTMPARGCQLRPSRPRLPHRPITPHRHNLLNRHRPRPLLEPLPPLRKTVFLLVFPGLPVSSAWAYENLRMGLTRRAHALSMDQLKSILARYPDSAQGFYNRLEDAVCPAQPVVAEITSRLVQLGAPVALMSGSGSGVFAAFKRRADAVEARQRLGRTDWRMPIVESVQKGVELFE